jgi:hypothetical protein
MTRHLCRAAAYSMVRVTSHLVISDPTFHIQCSHFDVVGPNFEGSDLRLSGAPLRTPGGC